MMPSMRLTWMRWLLCGALPVACGDDGIATSDDSTTGGMTTGPSTSTTTPTSEPSSSSPQTDGSTSDDSSTGGGSDSTSLSGGSTDATTGSSSTTDSTGPIVETTSTTDPSSSSDSSGFIPPPDLGPAAECDLWMQDCPDGEKCEAWANDGGEVWNAWRCTPIAPVPGQAGDPCVVEGGPTTGIDDCALGLMCFYVDPIALTGSCVPHCTGAPDTPNCDDPSDICAVYNSPWLPMCLHACDPFLQDCDEAQACYSIDGVFGCFPDASGAAGEQYDECEYLNNCAPGLHCASVDNLPGCGGATCCTAWCDLTGFMCPDDMDCVPLYGAGEAPPGYEEVGFCGVPT
jgi:hypothetical protein